MAQFDGGQLGAVLDPNNTASRVWADIAYRSRTNWEPLGRRGLPPKYQRAKPRGWPVPAHISRGNATRARVRSLVEHMSTIQNRHMGLVVRCIGLVRATARITRTKLAHSLRRLVWIESTQLDTSGIPSPCYRPADTPTRIGAEGGDGSAAQILRYGGAPAGTVGQGR